MVIRPQIKDEHTIIPTNGENWIEGMPFDTSWRDAPREFVLMLFSALIEKMNFVGSCDGNGRIDRDI